MSLLDDINLILPSVLQAGEAIRNIYKTDFEIFHKQKNDPLTEADIQSNDIIVRSLKHHFPQDATLSEEIPDNTERLTFTRLWVLDPLDGTREFVEKTDEFAITLGLAINGEAMAGIIFNPITGELFVGIVGLGLHTFQFSQNTIHPATYTLLEKDFHKKEIPRASEKPFFLVSNSEFRKGLYQNPFWQQNVSVRTTGSIAYKLALLAQGKCEMVVSLRHKNEWDVCGGAALLKSIDGIVTDLNDFSELTFNNPKTLIDGILAGHPDSVNRLRETYKQHLVLS